MTPKEKAKYLYDYYFPLCGHIDPLDKAKQCALICVEEIMKSFEGFMDQRRNFRHELEIEAERYWQSVKTEIEKL